METDINKDITNLTYSEITELKRRVFRDKKFISDKVIFWNEQYREILSFEKKLVEKQKKIKDYCEECNQDNTSNEIMKILPDGRYVCSSCWKKIVDETFIKNYNKIMIGIP